MGLSAETLHTGTAGRLMRASKALTAAGALGAALFGGRSRIAAVISGLMLMAGSACTRFGVFEAGRSRPRTRSTPSSRSGNGWIAAAPPRRRGGR